MGSSEALKDRYDFMKFQVFQWFKLAMGLNASKGKKRQSIKFIRDIFWRQQSC